MTHVTCRLTAKYRDQLRNPMLGNRICVLPLPFRTVVGRQQLHATARHSTQIPLADRPHLLQQLRGLRLRGVAVTGVSRFYRLYRPNRRYLLSAVGRRNHKDRRRDAVRTEKPHSSVQRHGIYSRTTTDSIGFCVVNGSALLILHMQHRWTSSYRRAEIYAARVLCAANDAHRPPLHGVLAAACAIS